MQNILICVDMQNGFVQDKNTAEVIARIRPVLASHIFDTVIATRFINKDFSMYEQCMGWTDLKSERSQAVKAELQPYIDEYWDKFGYTCVTPSFIERLCQINKGICPSQVFIAGIDTDCCVLKIATDLFEHHIRPVVLARYCFSTGGYAAHARGLSVLRRLIGASQIYEGLVTAESVKKDKLFSC